MNSSFCLEFLEDIYVRRPNWGTENEKIITWFALLKLYRWINHTQRQQHGDMCTGITSQT